MASTTDSESSKPARIRDEISERIIEIVARIAEEEGAHKVTVRKIITELGVTNRVFYNRFANCDEVLRIVYRNAIVHMRENIKPEFHDKESFERFCIDTAVSVLMQTYDVKMQFRRYVFEHDSLTEENRRWWYDKIKNITGMRWSRASQSRSMRTRSAMRSGAFAEAIMPMLFPVSLPKRKPCITSPSASTVS